MAKQSRVNLTEDERATLRTLTQKGSVAARHLTRAHLLRHAAGQATDEDLAQALPIGTATAERTRKRCVEAGLEAALNERPRAGGHRQLAGQQAALLVALACSPPPDERQGWTRPLLADNLVALKQVESIAEETVRRPLQKTSSNPG